MHSGAVLCDATLSDAAGEHWFDPAWWRARGALNSTHGGRGQVHFLRSEHGADGPVAVHGDRADGAHTSGDLGAGAQDGSSQPGSADPRRRTPIHNVERSDEWVLRPYRRGGLVRHVSTARYLWLGEARTRSFAEWRLLARLYNQGLPVPRPVAAYYRRHGLFLYSAALITVCLPTRQTLRDLMLADRVPEGVWESLGGELRRLHDAGVSHRDLNAANVMVGADAQIYLIDFDRGHSPEWRWQQGNLARLHRSLRKTAALAGGGEFDPRAWEALLQGYRQGYGERPERLSRP